MTEDSQGVADAGLRKKDGSPFRVLIVDDSAFVIKQISRMMKSGGYDVAGTALDGLQAIEQYKELKPDIVTMDITMPNMNGVQAVEEILKLDKTAKIIVISAIGHEEIVKKAILKGAKHYVVKPMDLKSILKGIHKVLEKDGAV